LEQELQLKMIAAHVSCGDFAAEILVKHRFFHCESMRMLLRSTDLNSAVALHHHLRRRRHRHHFRQKLTLQN